MSPNESLNRRASHGRRRLRHIVATVPALFARISLAVGQLLFLAAFRSGDPTGLQYIPIFVGLWPIGLVAAILGWGAAFGRHSSLALPLNVAASVGVAALPDRPGAMAIITLLIWQAGAA